MNRFETAINNGNWDAFDELLTDDFQRHCMATPDAIIESRDAFKQLQMGFLESMPNQRIDTEFLVAEGDKVAAYSTYSGTLTGPMGDIPATGKSAAVTFMTIFRIEEGRIAEIWVEWDNIAMLSQLGLFPPPAPPVEN